MCKKVKICILFFVVFTLITANLIPVSAEINRNAYEDILCVTYDECYGYNPPPDKTKTIVGNNGPGKWLMYEDVDFGDDPNYEITSFIMTLGMDSGSSTPSNISIHLDNSRGQGGMEMVTFQSMNTGAWGTYVDVTANNILHRDIKGKHDVYISFDGSWVGNLKSFRFVQAEKKGYNWDIDEDIPAIQYDEKTGSSNISNGVLNNIGHTDTLTYKSINFGDGSSHVVALGVEMAGNSGANLIIKTKAEPSDTDYTKVLAKVHTYSTKDFSDYQWQYFSFNETELLNFAELTGVNDILFEFYGSSNTKRNMKTIKFLSEEPVYTVNPYEDIVAASAVAVSDFSKYSGPCLVSTNSGTWARYKNLDFSLGIPNYISCTVGVEASYAEGTIEAYINEKSSENHIASVKIKGTGSFSIFGKNVAKLDGEAIQKLQALGDTPTDLILEFKPKNAVVGNFLHFNFFSETLNPAHGLYADKATYFHKLSKGSTNYLNRRYPVFSSASSSSWIKFEAVDFGTEENPVIPELQMSLIYAIEGQYAASSRYTIYVDAMDVGSSAKNTPLHTFQAADTGGFSSYVKSSTVNPSSGITSLTGIHDIYIKYSLTGNILGLGFGMPADYFEVIADSAAFYSNNVQITNLNDDQTSVTAYIDIVNNKPDDQNVVMILALYKGDELIKVTFSDSESSAKKGDRTPIDATMDVSEVENLSKSRLVLLVWDNTDDIIPLLFTPITLYGEQCL